MKDLQLTIPGDILATTKIPRQRLEAQLKTELALQLYREGLIAGGGACRQSAIVTGAGPDPAVPERCGRADRQVASRERLAFRR